MEILRRGRPSTRVYLDTASHSVSPASLKKRKNRIAKPQRVDLASPINLFLGQLILRGRPAGGRRRAGPGRSRGTWCLGREGEAGAPQRRARKGQGRRRAAAGAGKERGAAAPELGRPLALGLGRPLRHRFCALT